MASWPDIRITFDSQSLEVMERLIAACERLSVALEKPKEEKIGPFQVNSTVHYTREVSKCQHCGKPLDSLTGHSLMTNGILTQDVCGECFCGLTAFGWHEVARAK